MRLTASDPVRPARHGLPWSQQEKDLLVRRFQAGVSISDLELLHQRSQGGIKAELQRQGLWPRQG